MFLFRYLHFFSIFGWILLELLGSIPVSQATQKTPQKSVSKSEKWKCKPLVPGMKNPKKLAEFRQCLEDKKKEDIKNDRSLKNNAVQKSSQDLAKQIERQACLISGKPCFPPPGSGPSGTSSGK